MLGPQQGLPGDHQEDQEGPQQEPQPLLNLDVKYKHTYAFFEKIKKNEKFVVLFNFFRTTGTEF